MKMLPRILFALVVIAGWSVADRGTAAPADDPEPASEVKLERLTWKQFQKRLAEKKDIKYTMVDVWSTVCGPCKENFPHVLEMHRKYGKKGLAVISLSLDDPTDESAVAAASNSSRNRSRRSPTSCSMKPKVRATRNSRSTPSPPSSCTARTARKSNDSPWMTHEINSHTKKWKRPSASCSTRSLDLFRLPFFRQYFRSAKARYP